ncbi:SHOCT domain-containing protein [Streptomyces sp. NPDC051018]|uniref:SHOCT domain-containing protein n=1 Tax=Streptomyces sp. NPDC051018 TaxID=3365639 RepID=UPI0037A6B522
MPRVRVRPDIDAAAARIPAVGLKREIYRLPTLLPWGETVDILATGERGKYRIQCLVVLTNMRLFCFRYSLLTGRLDSFRHEDISDVAWFPRRLSGTLKLTVDGTPEKIVRIPVSSGAELKDRLLAILEAGRAGPSSEPLPEPSSVPADSGTHSPSPEQDIVSRLATLDRLRDTGTITDTEYQEQRRRILDRI